MWILVTMFSPVCVLEGLSSLEDVWTHALVKACYTADNVWVLGLWERWGKFLPFSYNLVSVDSQPLTQIDRQMDRQMNRLFSVFISSYWRWNQTVEGSLRGERGERTKWSDARSTWGKAFTTTIACTKSVQWELERCSLHRGRLGRWKPVPWCGWWHQRVPAPSESGQGALSA